MARDYKLAIIINAIDKASPVLGGLGKVLGGLGKVAVGLGVGAAAGVGALGVGLTKLAIDAAPLQGVQAAFEGITEASGHVATDMLRSLEKGSKGMIAQRDLMKSYNLAAQLVGDQFAERLPEAMGYLTKVSSSTGQSMDYMMDSLVRGVGRLSPMILDNLAIQVSLEEATAKAAEMFGVQADELSKAQIQAGMTEVVLAKLAQTTANMPDVSGMAATSLAALGAKFQNLKDAVGVAFLPALDRLLGLLSDLVDKWGPKIAVWAEKAGEWFAGVVDELAIAIEGGWPAIWERLKEWGARFWDWLTGPGGAIEKTGTSLQSVLDKFTTWLDENWPIIAEHLTEWGKKFWDWINEQVLVNAPAQLATICEAITNWAEDPDTQAKLADIGEKVGKGLVVGVEFLVGTTETWVPVMAKMLAALVEAGVPAMWEASKALASGFARGFTEAIGVEVPKHGFLGQALGWGGGRGYQWGGVVPGPIGMPQLAMVHGGETITPAGGGGGGRIVVEHLCPACLRVTVSEEMNRQLERGAGPAWRR